MPIEPNWRESLKELIFQPWSTETKREKIERLIQEEVIKPIISEVENDLSHKFVDKLRDKWLK